MPAPQLGASRQRERLEIAPILGLHIDLETREQAHHVDEIHAQNPHLAHARATLVEHTYDIIDGADMIKLAERELMTPLDQEARRIVSVAAQRVSVVTAVSRTGVESRAVEARVP